MVFIQSHQLVGMFLTQTTEHTTHDDDGVKTKFWHRSLTVVDNKGETQRFDFYSDIQGALETQPYDHSKVAKLQDAYIKALNVQSLEELGL